MGKIFSFVSFRDEGGHVARDLGQPLGAESHPWLTASNERGDTEFCPQPGSLEENLELHMRTSSS